MKKREFQSAGQALQFLRERQTAYQAFFLQPAGQVILSDLAEFCFAHQTTYDSDERLHARKEGRRDVWLRIQHHLNLSDADLYAISMGRQLPPASLET